MTSCTGNGPAGFRLAGIENTSSVHASLGADCSTGAFRVRVDDTALVVGRDDGSEKLGILLDWDALELSGSSRDVWSTVDAHSDSSNRRLRGFSVPQGAGPLFDTEESSLSGCALLLESGCELLTDEIGVVFEDIKESVLSGEYSEKVFESDSGYGGSCSNPARSA